MWRMTSFLCEGQDLVLVDGGVPPGVVPDLQEGPGALVAGGHLVGGVEGPDHAAELGHGEGQLAETPLH